MKKWLVLLVVVLSLSACTGGSVKKISAAEAKTMMEDQDVIIVDVRTLAEYQEGHIQGALLIPNESIGSDPIALLDDKDAVILVYCRSGNRSAQAAQKLIKLGYKNVYDFGGVIDWPYGLVK